MREIKLTKGLIALVDDEDYEWLSKFNWHPDKDGYAIRSVKRLDDPKKWTSLAMHREILGLMPGDGIECDHGDKNKLNNQRYNLRAATRSQNNHNKSAGVKSSSPYKGVTWHKAHNRWAANIRYMGKGRHLGYYDTADEANEVYGLWACMIFSDFADFGLKEAA